MDRQTFYKGLGRNIRELRLANQWTQGGLASHIGVSRDVLANIETGRQNVHVHQLIEIANALGGRSIESLLPANLWASDSSTIDRDLKITGSPLSAEQKRQVAGIIDLIVN